MRPLTFVVTTKFSPARGVLAHKLPRSTITGKLHIPDELFGLLDQVQKRVERLLHLNPDDPEAGDFQFRELADLSREFLALAKGFIAMSNTALEAMKEMERRRSDQSKEI